MSRIVIAGGSGFLGRSLAHHLAGAYEIIVLSRSAPRESGPWRHVPWDARSLGPWWRELDGATGLVNLVGRTVDCIKTPDHCDEILRSRVEATRALGLALRELLASGGVPPPVWVQMSTAHIYGDPPQVRCEEGSAFGYGLAPTVGRAWEEAYAQSVLPAQRQVILRTSFVVGRGGGALARLAMLTRWGLGGRVGDGRQGMSWIHEHDLNRLFERALTDPSMRGAFIASSPNPVSQAEFMRELRRAMRVRIGLPAPAWLVRIGARWIMRTDPELALYGRYCASRRLRDEGFEFRFPELRGALADLFSPREPGVDAARIAEQRSPAS